MQNLRQLSHRKAHARRVGSVRGMNPRWHIAIAGVLGVLLFLATAFGLAWIRLQGNVNVEDIDSIIGDRPSQSSQPPIDPNAGHPINLLVMGSDVRAGDFADSNVEGMRSDATMLIHIAADRSRIDAVSIPRDLRIDIPSCTLHDGTTTKPGKNRKFNDAFARGGEKGNVSEAAACTIKTVESLTGIYIDDYVVVDFQGFQTMVDALGGVPLYFPKDVDDRRADLHIKKGCRLLDGHDALAAARSRYAQGDGSDIGRIDRQQQLVAAIIREALSRNLLTNMPSLYTFLDAATQSLSTGPQIGSLSTMAGLAYSVRNIDPAHITFMTAPFDWAGSEIYMGKDAERIWTNIIMDRPLTYDPSAATASASPSPSETASPDTASPTPSASATTSSPTPTPSPTLEHGTTAEQDDEFPTCTRANAEPNE